MKVSQGMYLGKYILVGLLVTLVCSLVLLPCSVLEAAVPTRYKLAAENEYLQLYLDEATTEIAIVDRDSGRIWYSNPDNPKTKGQLLIEYYTPNDGFRTMNNYSDSVKYKQFDITEIEHGIRIDYLMGLAWSDRDYLPTFISAERFDELILSQIENEKDRQFVRNSYIMFSLEEAPADYQRVSIPQLDKEALFGSHTMMIETNPVGRSRADFIRHVLDQYRLERTDITSITQIKPELIESFRENPTMVISPSLWPWDLEPLVEIIKASGYRPTDKQYDNETYHIDPPEQPIEIFTVPMEYQLDDDSLVVRIPMKDVKYPKNVYTSQTWGLRGVHWTVVEDPLLMEAFGRIEGESVSFPLYAVNLLRFFGSPDLKTSGYILIPDGSGALINLSGNRVRQTNDLILQQPLYGRDLSNIGGPEDAVSEQELQRHFQKQLLPVFGMNHGDAGFFSIIERGDALASIVVETSGKVNPVDTVYAKFKLIPVGRVQLAQSARGGGGAYVNTYQPILPESDIQVRYLFLEGEDANYSGMARLYQQYLVERYNLDKVTVTSDIPFYLELIGGIHRKKPIMGIPRTVIEPLTTHDQVKTLVDEIQAGGIENLVLRYRGWLEGGIDHVYPSKVFLETALGNRSSFISLVNYLNDKEISFYPDVTFTVAAKTRYNDGFKVSTHTAYSLNKYLVRRELPSGTNSYVLSMSKLDLLLASFLADYNTYNIKGLSLSDLGTNINSDFQEKEEELIDRQEARDVIASAVSRIAEQKSLIIDKANTYALVHADHVLNVPLNSSGFVIADREIPFYQMVIHGYVNYAGEPINYTVDSQETLLKILEIGANPYFLWGYADSSIVKDTPFQYLLSTNYSTWLDFALEFYQEVNSVLKPLQGQTIVAHNQLDKDVYETVYENGTRIVVNYGDVPVHIEEHLIDSRSYLVMEGEEE